MKGQRNKIITGMGCLVAASWLLAGEVYAAERAIWVWGMADDIVLNAGAKQQFFNFCAAPHGDATKAITLVFFDARPYGVNLMTYNSGADLRNFLSDAHSRGIKVEFLSGDKSWATPQYKNAGEGLINEVTDFNLAGAATERFDGIQYDVEPYLLDTKKKNDPLDWNYDRPYIWNTYLALLENCQAKVNAYNAANNPDIRFGAAIPRWYQSGSATSPESIIDRVDYIAIMDYRDAASQMISDAQDEISYAAGKGKKVYIGVETTHPTDTVEFPPSTTFYEEGNAAMETALAEVHSRFLTSAAYAGIALHYYEDLTGPRGTEISYRSLWTTSNPYKGRYPVVSVLSPNRADEVLFGIINIQWEATDLDGNLLAINIQYSSDGGANWIDIAAGLPNTGNYAWNTTTLPPASNYLVKVIATDNSGASLAGYDISDSPFTISGAIMPGDLTDITDLHLWNESPTSLRLKWTPPNFTPRYYRVYRSVNGGPIAEISGSPVITVNKYIDANLTGADKYKYQIRAVYGDGTEGNPSNASNMLIPGDTFLLDYCEETEGLRYDGPYGAGLTHSFYDKTIAGSEVINVKEGNKSLRLSYTYPGTGWGGILIGTFTNPNTPPKLDISPYNAVKFWLKGFAHGNGDVNEDGIITPLDALMVINYLNGGTLTPDQYIRADTNRDGEIWPIDEVIIINYLNANSGGPPPPPIPVGIPPQIRIQLRENGGIDGDEAWQSPVINMTTTTWVQYQINFSDFTRESILSGAGNNRLDTHNIGAYAIVFYAGAASITYIYQVDEMRFISEGANISVPQDSYTFGTVVGSFDDHRFRIGPIPVTFSGYGPPWTIRLWTNNGTGAAQAGLQGADGVNHTPLKVWCANFGPTASVPDEENEYFYAGYDFGDGTNIGRQYQNGSKEDVYRSGTFDENYWGFDINGDGVLGQFNAAAFNVYEGGYWYRIPEYNEMTANRYTWRRLTWAPGAELPSLFNIYLAIDVLDVAVVQLYKTTTLTLEFINE